MVLLLLCISEFHLPLLTRCERLLRFVLAYTVVRTRSGPIPISLESQSGPVGSGPRPVGHVLTSLLSV